MRWLYNLTLFFFAMGIFQCSVASINYIDIGVNGLTCSMCSRSVEMSIRRLDFVDNVVMDLEKTEGRIFVKEDSPINLEAIAKAVVNAGFSVRFILVDFNLADIPVSDHGYFIFQGQTYEWLDFKDNIPKDSVTLKLVDEHFLPKKESEQWKKKFTPSIPPSTQKILHVIQEG
jgi:copper chaperone CopZ